MGAESERICGHCVNPMRGHASISEATGTVWLCHPDDGEDCYRLVTVWGHDTSGDCHLCAEVRVEWDRITQAAHEWARRDDPAGFA